MRYLLLFLMILLYACSLDPDNRRHIPDTVAVSLADSAQRVTYKADYTRALSLYEEAIKSDKNFFRAYRGKFSCQVKLKQYDAALATVNKLKKLRPSDPEHLLAMAVLHHFKNDSIAAEQYLNKTLTAYNRILDTSKTKNVYLGFRRMNKAIVLILLGKEDEGNQILYELIYPTPGDYGNAEDDDFVSLVAGSYVSKTKEEIFNKLVLGN